MGLTCKPVGKMKRIMAKLNNELQREKEAIKVKEKEEYKGIIKLYKSPLLYQR